MATTRGGTAVLRRWLRMLRVDTDVEVKVPIGCLVPMAAVLAVAIAVGVLIGQRVQPSTSAPSEAVVRVIDDGAPGGPAVVSTQIVPLR
jgi:hypothetical protein